MNHTDQILTKIKELIDTTNSILITGQGNPDGDSIGAQLALYAILLEKKRDAGNLNIVIANDELPPPRYQFLPYRQAVISWEEIRRQYFDVGFVLDSARDRVGKVLPVLRRCQYTINIDHHKNRIASEEDVVWIEPEKSSVAEMIYAFIEHPAWKATLTADIAACLYTGIIYDTGTFRYPATSPRTHQIAAKLIETGIDFAKITEQVVLEKPFSAIQLSGEVLNHLQHDATGEILWGVITQELLKRVHAQPEEDEGLITQYAFTKGVKVAVLFKERPANRVKVSFRSHGAIDVGQFAKKMSVEGGGHPRAAGCAISGTLNAVQELVIRALQEELALAINRQAQT